MITHACNMLFTSYSTCIHTTCIVTITLHVQTADNHCTYMRKHILDPSQLSLVDYIKAVVGT